MADLSSGTKGRVPEGAEVYLNSSAHKTNKSTPMKLHAESFHDASKVLCDHT